jgi:hypothetical protein
MAKQGAEELVIYKSPPWVYLGWLLAVAGCGLLMWAGAESKISLIFAGAGVMIVGSIVIWLQRLHKKAWAKKNELPV